MTSNNYMIFGYMILGFVTSGVCMLTSYSILMRNLDTKINELDKLMDKNKEKIETLIDESLKKFPPNMIELSSSNLVKHDASSQTHPLIVEEKIEKEIIHNDILEDAELLDVCYTNLPCNNVKKVTGINKLFNWK